MSRTVIGFIVAAFGCSIAATALGSKFCEDGTEATIRATINEFRKDDGEFTLGLDSVNIGKCHLGYVVAKELPGNCKVGGTVIVTGIIKNEYVQYSMYNPTALKCE